MIRGDLVVNSIQQKKNPENAKICINENKNRKNLKCTTLVPSDHEFEIRGIVDFLHKLSLSSLKSYEK